MRETIRVAEMQDVAGKSWNVDLSLDGVSQPIVCISNISSPKHTYHASTFVGLGGRNYGFEIIGEFPDESLAEFSHQQWLNACISVRNAIPRSCGELDVRWIPDDPRLPF